MSELIQQYLAKVVDGHDLTKDEASRAFQVMMNGGTTPAQMAALLVALRMKGEAVSEIAGAAHTMRSKALPFTAPADAIDTCGTGGDATGTYNISTAVALVVAGCGVPVVKHGNRSVSSKSGSADVLQHLGVNLQAKPEVMQRALQEANICFLMAPNYHQATRHITPVRQELKLRTIFNLLGPLSNPAHVTRQLMGIYSRELVRPVAEVLLDLGAEHAWVVHGADGMDELSLTGPTHVAEVKDGTVREFDLTPDAAGLETCPMEALKGGTPAENAKALDRMLVGAVGAYRDIVLYNSAAALLIAGRVANLKEGVAMAAHAIERNQARQALIKLIDVTNG